MGSSYIKMLAAEYHSNGMKFSPTIKIPMPTNTSANLLVRPKEFILSNYIKSLPSKSLTVFTYTIRSGFSSLVVNSAKKCSGEVNIVFSFTQSPNFDKLSEQIYDILKESKLNSFNLYFSKSSHIKLFQRDDYLLVGSQNFSMSSDISKYSYDEIMMEYQEGGEISSKEILNYFKNNDKNICSENVFGKSKGEIECILKRWAFECGKDSISRTVVDIHKEDVVSHICQNFMIDIDERFSIEEAFEEKMDFISEFMEGTVNSFSEVIPLQGLIDNLESIMYDAYDKSIYLLDYIELDVDNKSEEMAQHTLCEGGYTDPDTGRAYTDSSTNKKLTDLIESIREDLLQRNMSIKESFVNEFNSNLSQLLIESLR